MLLLLAATFYGGSYCLLARSGVLMPGRRSSGGSAEDRFAMIQRKALTWNSLFERGQVDILNHRQVAANSQRMLKESMLTLAFRPAGYVHQLLADQDAWPSSLSPEDSVDFDLPGISETDFGDGPQELQRGVQQMEDFLANDPAWQNWQTR